MGDIAASGSLCLFINVPLQQCSGHCHVQTNNTNCYTPAIRPHMLLHLGLEANKQRNAMLLYLGLEASKRRKDVLVYLGLDANNQR